MPEGPEIRRAADQLQRTIVNRPLRKVWFKFAHLQQYQKRLSSAQVSSIETRGKALLTHFDCGLTIYSHNQLYGVWKISKTGKLAQTSRDLRLAIYSDKAAVLLYSASDIEVWQTAQLETHPFLRKLGPDALNPKLKPKHLQTRLQEKRFANKSLASLLLDQHFLAGMGNYLRTEVLYYAGLHPLCKPRMLDDEQIVRLAEQLIEVTQRSYRSGGVTNEGAISGQLEADGLPFEGYRFAAFERSGKPCYQCATAIERVELAGRRIYLCPHCQAAPAPSQRGEAKT